MVRSRFFQFLTCLMVCFTMLTACAVPQLRAEQRLFLPLSVEFLGSYDLPKTEVAGLPVGGLSGITYDRQRDRFYALSDDPGNYAPPRFYTLKLKLKAAKPVGPEASSSTATPATGVAIATIQVESVTTLKAEDGNAYSAGVLNPEGIALSPQQSVFVASEGFSDRGVAPAISEFDLQTGQWKRTLPLPKRYLPGAEADPPQGVENNAGFESLTLNPIVGNSSVLQDPFRLFTATEFALRQDQATKQSSSDSTDQGSGNPAREETGNTALVKNRLLHYLIQDGPPLLIAEHLYSMDLGPQWSLMNGLTELLAIDQSGHFLSLERSLGLKGYGARLFQLNTGGATDISDRPSLSNELGGVQAIRKQLLLDLAELGIPLQNLEGMTLGPQLPDGSRSLLLVSDDNFQADHPTQFLLFRLLA